MLAALPGCLLPPVFSLLSLPAPHLPATVSTPVWPRPWPWPLLFPRSSCALPACPPLGPRPPALRAPVLAGLRHLCLSQGASPRSSGFPHVFALNLPLLFLEILRHPQVPLDTFQTFRKSKESNVRTIKHLDLKLIFCHIYLHFLKN